MQQDVVSGVQGDWTLAYIGKAPPQSVPLRHRAWSLSPRPANTHCSITKHGRHMPCYTSQPVTDLFYN